MPLHVLHGGVRLGGLHVEVGLLVLRRWLVLFTGARRPILPWGPRGLLCVMGKVHTLRPVGKRML